MPSSMKSSGCGSRISSTPSRSKIGSSSSSDLRNIASAVSAASGRPLNSEFITVTPRSTAIWIARFQARTAACRWSSSGPDQRSTGSSEAMPTPASAVTFFSLRTPASSILGYLKNGTRSALGDSSIHS